MLPMAAPISRFRLTVRSFHSKRTMAAPISAPAPAFPKRGRLKGSIARQVRATTTTKRRRTKIISTVDLPADAGIPEQLGFVHPCPFHAAPGGELAVQMRDAGI